MTTSTVETSTTPDVDTTVEAPVFEKGTWEHTLQLSVQAEDKSKSAKILAGKRLRAGAWAAISAFLAEDGADPDALYSRVKSTGLSASTASKIKKVAVTARDYPEFGWDEVPMGALESVKPRVSDPKMSLNKADADARRLTDAPAVEAAEDSAFETAIEAITEAAPKTSTTVEGLIQIALSKAGDADEFVKVLIDVLSGPSGVHNAEACQAFIRTFASENGSRIKASKPVKEKTEKAAPTVKTKAAPTKPTPVKAKPGAKVTATPEVDAANDASDEPVQPEDFDWDDVDIEGETDGEPYVETDAAEAPVAQNQTKAKPVKKATPIRKA